MRGDGHGECGHAPSNDNGNTDEGSFFKKKCAGVEGGHRRTKKLATMQNLSENDRNVNLEEVRRAAYEGAMQALHDARLIEWNGTSENLSIRDAAKLLGISERTLHREISAGRLHPVKIRGRRLIPRSQLEAYQRRSAARGVAR